MPGKVRVSRWFFILNAFWWRRTKSGCPSVLNWQVCCHSAAPQHFAAFTGWQRQPPGIKSTPFPGVAAKLEGHTFLKILARETTINWKRLNCKTDAWKATSNRSLRIRSDRHKYEETATRLVHGTCRKQRSLLEMENEESGGALDLDCGSSLCLAPDQTAGQYQNPAEECDADRLGNGRERSIV